MTAFLSPVGNGQQFLTSQGVVLAGGKINTYLAGTNTPAATYTTSTAAVQNANPIILGSNGMAPNEIWLPGGTPYKFVITDANNNVLAGGTLDNLTGINDVASQLSEWLVPGYTINYVSTTSFSVAGDKTLVYSTGRRVRATVGTGFIYGRVVSATYDSINTNTTVVLSMDSTLLDASVTAVDYALLNATNPSVPASLPSLNITTATIGTGAITTITGLTSVNGHSIGGPLNKLINVGAEVAQRAAPSLTTSAQYGQVDRCAIWASGSTVTAGTITQVTTATVGRTGKAARAAGTTLPGSSGVISWRYRMESADAIKLKNQTGSFQIAVMHDVGINVNYTIIIRKPTAVDNYASTTVINTGSATVVAPGTATVLKSEGVALGDCSNGLEIEVQAACGGVITKNFDFTEWQLEEGATATTFERRSYAQELRDCRRYYQKYASAIINGYQGAGAIAYDDRNFYVPMFGVPIIGITSVGTSNSNVATTDLIDADHVRFKITVSALGYGFSVIDYTASAEL